MASLVLFHTTFLLWVGQHIWGGKAGSKLGPLKRQLTQRPGPHGQVVKQQVPMKVFTWNPAPELALESAGGGLPLETES